MTTYNANMALIRRMAVWGWLWAMVLGISFQTIEARRRNPLEETIHSRDPQGRRLTQDSREESSTGTATTSSAGLLTPDSVRGSRSVIGTNVRVDEPKSPDDHLVTNLPLLKDFPSRHWAGLLPVNDKKDGYLFYWLFAPDPEALKAAKTKGLVNEDESNVPLVLWLNGGPACSSMDGLWLENGPFRLDPGDGKKKQFNDIKIDPHSWHTAPAYTLYVDQPVGTGLAFTTSGNYPNNDERVNEDFYYFLTEFLRLHATTVSVDDKDGVLTLQRPFYFAGESHAGHYIPSMMNYIRKKNSKPERLKKKQGVLMPLSGAAIGNGWFDPYYQYSAHETAYGYGLIGKAQERALAQKEEQCRKFLLAKQYSSHVCFSLLSDVTSNSLGKTNNMVVSQYDQRVWEDRNKNRDFPPGHHDVEAYLGQLYTIANADVQDVLAAIHATPSWKAGQRYRECTDPPYNALAHQDGLGVVDDVVELLEDEASSQATPIRLLFFNGVQDLICNHAGNENALEHLPWKHRDNYVSAARYGWKSESTQKLGGYAKEYKNLVFLKVLNSGHMVPMDVPDVALDMMIAFLYPNGKSSNFRTYKQTLDSELETGDPSCPQCPETECPVVDCPACDGESGGSSGAATCTKQQCQKQFDFEPTKATTGNSGVSEQLSPSPTYSAVAWGVGSSFAVFFLLVFCLKCFGSSKGGGGRMGGPKSQIELSENGGYRDDDDDPDADEYGDEGL